MTAAKSTNLARYWLPFIAISLIGGFLLYPKFVPAKTDEDQPAKRGEKKGPPNRQSTVSVAPAISGELNVFLNGLGTVTPKNSVTVKPRVDGQIMRLAFQEGQFVRAGDLLAEIDPRPFQVQLAQAEGQMARDQALLTNARADLERYRTLLEQDSIARQQLDTQESLVRQYEAVVKTDQSLIANARLQLTYSRVTAPISGRIGLKQVDAGNIVRTSDANGLVVITQLQPITTVFTIPEDQLPPVMQSVRHGKRLKVEAFDRAQTSKLADGALLTVDNQIDVNTGSIKLKAEFENKDSALFPNQFVNVRLHLDTLKNVTLIPSAAVQRGPKGTFTFVLNPDKTVALRPVKTGGTEGSQMAIEEGISPGELVVVDGLDKLRDGAKVSLAGERGGPEGADGRTRGKRHDPNAPPGAGRQGKPREGHPGERRNPNPPADRAA